VTFDDPFTGMKRRGSLADAYGGDAARFSSIFDSQIQPVRDFATDMQAAGLQHQLAVAQGPGSIAARNDPLRDSGTLFARQYPGAYDAFNDASNGMQRRSAAPAQPSTPVQPDAMTRYAAGMGYGANGGYNPTGAGTYYAQQGGADTYDPATGSLRRRRPDFGNVVGG